MAYAGTQAQQALWARQNRASADYAHIPRSVEWGVYGMETNFGRYIGTSSAGAKGLMQFLQVTARQWHYPYTDTPSPSESQDQFTAAALYLRQLFRGRNSWDLALRAYSGGGYGINDVNRKAASFNPPSGAVTTPASGYIIIGTSATGITSIDDGIDMTLTEDAHALGNGHVLWRSDNQWAPWGAFLSLSLDDGSRRGWHYYIAEGILPTVTVGQRVSAGQLIARRARNGGNGIFGNIETGWAGFRNPRLTLAQERGHGGERPSPEGTDYAGFYRNLDPLGVSATPPVPILNPAHLAQMLNEYGWAFEIYAGAQAINTYADRGYHASQQARREILGISTFTTTGGR